MAYRSNKIKAAPGVDVVADTSISTATRLRNAALDIAVLPLVAATRSSRPDIVGGPVPLHYGFRRWDWRTERGLELALATRAVAGYRPNEILEIGNVLAPAGVLSGHTVVDKYEEGPGVLNVDIVEYQPERTFGLVISISTLEHVGWDETPREPDKASGALHHLAGLGNALMISIPVGHHRQLEAAFIDGPFDSVTLAVKTSRLGRWERRPLDQCANVEYNAPFAYGNGILVGVRAAT